MNVKRAVRPGQGRLEGGLPHQRGWLDAGPRSHS